MNLKKIDNVMFYVKDLDKSAEFYSNVLGLNLLWKDEKYKMIGFSFAESDSEIVIHSDPSIPNPDMSFLVDNVVLFCEYFTSKGYKVLREPFPVHCGMFTVISDLDENIINIIDLTAIQS